MAFLRMRLPFFYTCFFFIFSGITLAPYQAQASPPLDEMLGQMIMVGFRGTVLTQNMPLLRDIEKHHIGGVILFNGDSHHPNSTRNISTAKQLDTLTTALQRRAHTPLFIALDQEGGAVKRLSPAQGFPPMPSAKRLGKGTVNATRAQAEKTGRLLSSLGINLNFAPVVDVDINPDCPVIGKLGRSFSKDPKRVSLHAQAFSRGLLQAGVLPCLKHFPGHGSSTQDSHQGFVDCSRTWQEKELLPYKTLLHQGTVPMIMVGHIYVRPFDPYLPATLSNHLLQNLLREELGFTGVIISDDLQMKAITDHYTLEETLILAINAGNDILLFGNNLAYDENIVPEILQLLHRAVARGHIRKKRIVEAYTRIMRVKKFLHGPKNTMAMNYAAQTSESFPVASAHKKLKNF